MSSSHFLTFEKELNLPFLRSIPSPCQVMSLIKWHWSHHVTIEIPFKGSEEGLYVKEKKQSKIFCKIVSNISLSLVGWNVIFRKRLNLQSFLKR